MDMKKKIKETLAPLNIPFAFATRKENNFPFIIYNITSEKGYSYEEDEEMVTRYAITVTIYSKGNYEDIKNKIIDAMIEEGFIRANVPSCFYMEDIEVFSQPIDFTYYDYQKINDTK